MKGGVKSWHIVVISDVGLSEEVVDRLVKVEEEDVYIVIL